MHKKISIIIFQIFIVFTEEEKVCDLLTFFRKTDQYCYIYNKTLVETSNQECYFIRKLRKDCYITNSGVLSQKNKTNLNVINKKDQIIVPTSKLNEFIANNLTIISMLVMYYLLKKFVDSTLKENGPASNEINSGILEDTKIVASTLEENGPASNEIKSGIPDDTNKTFSHQRYVSLSEQYDEINNLELSTLTECLETVCKFNETYKAEIISCIANKSQINEEMELSLNCLYVSINIISKYIEHHLPSVLVSDSSLVVAFDGFCNFISTHHLAERICESILYAMCSLMKLSNNKINKKFWKNKLEKLLLNDKLSEENKLASCVILVQLDISNKYLFDIHKYLSDIDLDCCEEYFGFSKSEILSARSNSEKIIENLSKATANKFKVVSYKLRFQIANQFDETKIFVTKFDNVIKLKKSICDGNMIKNDYKRMIMKYKGVTLDNNQYLLSYIDSTNIYPIICEFDDNVDVEAMIVIKLKCDNIFPKMLQIWKIQTIKDLKIIISELNKTNHEDLLIFYKSNQLDDDKTIDFYKIEDNDWINVVNKSHVHEMGNMDEQIEYPNLKIFKGRNKNRNNLQTENFQITGSHPRFFHLNNIFIYNSWTHIGLDIFREITLKAFLPFRDKIETTFEIFKWASHIPEGLKQLSHHNIILKNMNTIDICIACITEYLRLNIECKYKDGYSILALVIPGILESKPYGAIADVWSSEDNMIKVGESVQLFHGINSLQMIQIIKKLKTNYHKTNRSDDLINPIY